MPRLTVTERVAELTSSINSLEGMKYNISGENVSDELNSGIITFEVNGETPTITEFHINSIKKISQMYGFESFRPVYSQDSLRAKITLRTGDINTLLSRD